MYTTYTDGQVKYYDDVDIDHLSYFEVLGMVKELGYTEDAKMYYCEPNVSLDMGLKLWYDDSLIPVILNSCKNNGVVKVYVEQLSVPESVGKEVNEGIESMGQEVNEGIETIDEQQFLQDEYGVEKVIEGVVEAVNADMNEDLIL